MNTLYPVVFPNPTIDLVTKSSDSGDNARTVFGSNFPGMPPLQENPNAKKQKKSSTPTSAPNRGCGAQPPVPFSLP